MAGEDDTKRKRRQAIPVEIDPESTPPPMPIPSPLHRTGFESIPPPIKDTLVDMHRAQVELTEAVQRVWAARNIDERVEKLAELAHIVDRRTILHEEAINKFLSPAIKSSTATVMHVAAKLEASSAKIDRSLDYDIPKLVTAIDALEKQMASVTTNAELMTKLEQQRETAISARFNHVTETLKQISSVLDVSITRLRAVEDKQLTWSAKLSLLGVVAGGSGGVGAILSWLIN